MNKYARPENFATRIRNPLLREHYVYRAFNAEGELLYVGCSYDLEKRLQCHRSQSREWWSQQVRITVTGPYNYETARELERQSIYDERPLFNYTPERRAIAKAHAEIVDRELNYSGIDVIEPGWTSALEHALSVARDLVPYVGNRHALRVKDGDVFKARAANAEHARQCAARQVAS